MPIDDQAAHGSRLTRPRIRTRAVCSALAVAFVVVNSEALAAERVRVAVVHVRDDEPSRRIRAELGAAGLEAVDVPLQAGDARSAVAVARNQHTVAAVRIVSPDEMELAIVESESDAVLYDKVVRSSGAQNDSLAIRAVEDLRARLVKLHLVEPTPAERPQLDVAPQPAPGKPEQDGGPRAEPAAARRSLWATGAFGTTASGGGLGGNIAARVGLRLDATPRFGGSVAALMPLASQTVSTAGAHADVNVYAVSALLHYALVNAAQWGVDVGAGGGVVVARMEGFSESPAYIGRSETLVAGAPFIDGSLSYRPISMLRVRGEVLAGVAVPRLAVTFDQNDVAVWGRPFAALLLGAEIALSSELEQGATR